MIKIHENLLSIHIRFNLLTESLLYFHAINLIIYKLCDENHLYFTVWLYCLFAFSITRISTGIFRQDQFFICPGQIGI